MNEDRFPKCRNEAVKVGAKFYFTDEPCRHGHFSKRSTATTKCMQCASEVESSRRTIFSNVIRERRASRRRERFEAEPETRDKERRRSREYMARKRRDDQEFKDRSLRYARESKRRRRQDPAIVALERAAAIEWQKNNPEAVRARNHKRRAKVRNAEGYFSKSDIENIQISQGHKCAFCGCGTLKSFHVDHKLPISRGGTNWPDNIQILCAPCNLKKGAKTNEEFLSSINISVANDNNRLVLDK